MSPSSNAAPKILVVDNHDSFVHIIVDVLTQLGAAVTFLESEAVTDPDRAIADVDAVVISPGPGAPEEASGSLAVVRAAAATATPLLGVCLGHQVVAVAFGGTVSPALEPMHGRTSVVSHNGGGLFRHTPSPTLQVGRYHSLAVVPETLPDTLEVTAVADDGVVMGIAHTTLPIEGVQFHPESVLTPEGTRLLAAWLHRSGLRVGGSSGAETQGPLQTNS